MKMKKLEKKLSKLEEQKANNSNAKLDKKIMKLEKKKAKLEKWLKIKLPFRILIKGLTTWLIIGGVCYGCSYVPAIKEVKMIAMATISYVAPEPVTKVLDVVTLNVGVSNNDFEWLKTTLQKYINEEVELKTKDNVNTGVVSNYNKNTGEIYYTYFFNGKEITEEEYEQHVSEINEGLVNTAEEVLGATTSEEIEAMTISEILMKITTNATPELVSELLDKSYLTEESKDIIKQDANKALKILPRLNNNQMSTLVNIINEKINIEKQKDNEYSLFYQNVNELEEKHNQLMEKEQELLKEYGELIKKGDTEKANSLLKETYQIQLEAAEVMIQKYTKEYELALKEGNAQNIDALKGYIKSFEESKEDIKEKLMNCK